MVRPPTGPDFMANETGTTGYGGGLDGTRLVYQQVEAEPTVDFSRLEEVQILMTDTKDCAPVPEKRPRR